MKLAKTIICAGLWCGALLAGQTPALARGVDFPLFDTQVHFYSSDFAQFPLHAQHAYMGEAVMTARAAHHPNDPARVDSDWRRMGVGAGVGIQYGAAYQSDNRYLLSVAAHSNGKITPVVIVDPDAPDAPAELARLAAAHGVAGFRKIGKRAPDGSYPWLASEGMLRLWQVADQARLVVELMPYPRSPDPRFLHDIGQLAERFPHARIVLDHCAWPAPIGAPSYGFDASYAALAQHRNVYLKVTTENFARVHYDQALMRGQVERAVHLFGAGHVMWGSDMGNTMIPYAEMVNHALAATAGLSPQARKDVLDETGRRVYAAGR